MTPRAYLIAAGEALFGPAYPGPLSRALGVSRQHMLRLVSEREVQEHHVARARALLSERGETIRGLLAA